MVAKKASAHRRSLPESDWPATDRSAWQAARRLGNIFDGEARPAANWSKDATKNFISRYGRWLGWVLRAHPDTVGMHPEERVTPERLREYLERLKADALSDVTIHAFVRSLLTGMTIFASQMDWRWLRIVETNLRRLMTPSVDKRHQIRRVRDLYAYGIELMEEADASRTLAPIQRAILYRDGLLIAIFASRAPRRGVVTLMEIGKHLVREGDRYWLAFDEREMKGRRDSNKYLPVHLTLYMERYLERYRRVLLRDLDGLSDVPGLWIGEHRQSIGGPGIRAAVCKRTLAKFGVAIPPHRFRDCMATSFAYEDPANLGAATSVLDHTDPGIVNKHYNQGQGHAALRRVHSNLDALRDDLKSHFERWRRERQEMNADDQR